MKLDSIKSGVCSLLLILYITLLYFENWTPALFSSFLLTSKVQLIFVMVTLLCEYNQIVKILKKYSYLLTPLLIYCLYFFIVNLYSAFIWDMSELINLTFISNVLTLICSLLVIYNNPRILLSLAILNVIVVDLIYVCAQMGIGITLETEFIAGVNRLWIFGLNPNGLALYAVVSGICCVFALLQNIAWYKKLFFLISMIAVVLLIIMCGSQGGVILLFVSLVIMFWRKIVATNKMTILPLFIIVSIALYYLFNFILTTDIFVARLQEYDITSGRVDLFSRGVEVFLQSPVVGSGIAGYNYYMDALFHEVRPTHNGYLDILVYTGIIGFLIYMFYLLRTFYILTIQRKDLLYAPTVALFIVIALNFAKDGGVLFSKISWIFFAILIALPFEFGRVSMFIKCITRKFK